MDQKQVTSKEVYEQRLPDGSLYGQIGPRDWRRFEDTARYIRHDAESVLDVGCFCGDWLHYVLKHHPSIQEPQVTIEEKAVSEITNKLSVPPLSISLYKVITMN
jgi:hypothetical protein